jgi:hypothetical protein
MPALPTRPTHATPRKRRWPWFAAALALILAAILLPWTQIRHSDELPVPVHFVTLDVKLTHNIDGRGLPAGLLGKDVFVPHLRDTVTVDARLTRPAYAYLIAFQPDGKMEVCFPEAEDEPPSLTDNPRYPSTAASAEQEYGLSDGEGLQAFAVVVSSKPLPAFKDWWPQPGCPWKTADAPLGVMYRANGEDPVQAWGAANQARSKGVEVAGKKPVGELAGWLRQIPGIETVQVLGFAVAPAEKR